MTLRCGDIVRHIPSGREWTVAYACANFVTPKDPPEAIAELHEVQLVRTCSDAEHRSEVELWRRSIPCLRRARVLEMYS